MTGAPEINSACPICGGKLKLGTANIPFLLEHSVVVVKSVPAEICGSCREPFLAGDATDRVTALLNRLTFPGSEVTVVSYPAYALAL